MRLRTATTFIVLVASAALAGPTPPPGQLIDVWIRPSGDAPRKPITIDLSTKPKTEVTRDDFQYEGMKAKYRGVSLRALLDTLERPGRTDLALLHFNNGMIIPLPTDDYELMKTLDPFVATELKVNDLWITAFPMVTKKGAEGRDARPLKFQFNKVVVGTNLHPFTSKAAQADGFSPFFFADSLVGIELVRAENWYKQFDVGTTPEEKRGFAVFKSHCQYCHATRSRRPLRHRLHEAQARRRARGRAGPLPSRALPRSQRAGDRADDALLQGPPERRRRRAARVAHVAHQGAAGALRCAGSELTQTLRDASAGSHGREWHRACS